MRLLMVEDSSNKVSQKNTETSCNNGACFGTQTTCTDESSDTPKLSPTCLTGISGIAITDEVRVSYQPNPRYNPPSSDSSGEHQSCSEDSPLIPAHEPNREATVEPVTTLQFYILLCKQRRVVASMLSMFTYSIIVGSFDATLPLHVEEAFGWHSSESGAMFLALQAPGIVLGPLAGWLRDRLGLPFPGLVSSVASNC
jgi:hypothetical protein